MFPPLLQSATEPIDPLASDFHEEIPAYVNRILSIYPLYIMRLRLDCVIFALAECYIIFFVSQICHYRFLF